MCHDKRSLKRENTNERDCKLPQGFITRKVIPSGLMFVKLVLVKYFFTTNPTEKMQDYISVEYIKAFV